MPVVYKEEITDLRLGLGMNMMKRKKNYEKK
jgi:hypothetical protein